MAKQNYTPDLIPANTIVEVVKLDNNSEFVGMKLMEYSNWKKLEKKKGFIYRCFQKGYSQFK